MPQQAAFGDSFLVQTPALDKLSNDLYLEQKQREAKQQQENAALDANMQKQLGNIREADVNDFFNTWDKYKTAKKELLKYKGADSKQAYQLQQQANQALAEHWNIINGSREQKEREKTLNAARAAHPDSFDDNYGTYMGIAQKTRLKDLGAVKIGDTTLDLSNPDTYSYKGTNTDFQKISKEAAGQPKAVYQVEAPVDASGLQTKITPYLYPNSPAQYFQSYMGALAQHKAGRDAALAWDKIPQDQKEYVDKAYNDLTPEQWQRRTGNPTPQKLIPANPDNKAEQFAIFQAKLHAISNEPKEGTPVFKTNEAKKFQMETDRQTMMERIRHSDAKDLIDYKKKIDPNDTQLNGLWVDRVIQNLKEDAKTAPTVRYTENGKVQHERNIALDPTLASSLQKAGITPLYITYMTNGKFRIVYPLKGKDGNPIKISTGANAGDYAVDETLSTPISEEQLGLALGKKNVTGKQRDKEIFNIVNKTSKTATPAPSGSWKDRAKKVQ